MTCNFCGQPFRSTRYITQLEFDHRFDKMKTLKQVTITPKFVGFIPEDKKQNVLYISKEYGVAVHLCLCGCGTHTVTPLGNNGWQLIENGDKVSLTPSIANYQYPCNSHYILTNNVANFV